MHEIYLDHAATTPLHPKVLEAMLPYLGDQYGNASSAHRMGRAARVAVEHGREQIAHILHAETENIIFTSGGTEANNLALRGLCHSGDRLITSTAEHEAILQTAAALEEEKVAVDRIQPGPWGAVTSAQLTAHLKKSARLVSLMYVNNETGAVTPLAALSEVCRQAGVLLHTDGVQAAGYLPLDVQTLGVDAMTLSGHKIYGPKGIGLLYLRSGLTLTPMLRGGAQERSRRGGTENVAAIVGMAAALEEVECRKAEASERAYRLRGKLQDRLTGEFADEIVVTTPPAAAPHILNVAFKPARGEPLDGEMLLLNLDVEGVMVSAGSACASGALEPSHVLMALGLDRDTASAAVRFSLGYQTTETDISEAADRLIRIVRRMRRVRT
ncbi:MAG: cysteine desulfurase family protein [Bacteroidota bacterium]|nr:cysteine desulfurase family protein [Bacteroidota bacterium]